MRAPDLIRFARDAATGNPLRASLLVLAMAIGVAAVVVLTALGDGARRYVINQFSSLGTNLVIVLPGRSQTGGFNPGNAITSTPRDLSIDDAQSLLRASTVRRVAPLIIGTSEISHGGKLREVMQEVELDNESGEWNADCTGRFRQLRSMLSTRPSRNGGFADLVLARTVVQSRGQMQEDGRCAEQAQPAHYGTVVLRYDGERYRVPKMLRTP